LAQNSPNRSDFIEVKVLFIFKSENFLVPTGICAISAIAREKKHETFLCEIKSQNPFKSVQKLRPDIIAYSASTGEAKHYLKLNSLLKRKFPRVFTFMGGPHPTFYPDVIYEGDLDAICVGEGEKAFADVLESPLTKESLDKIPNIVTADNRNDFTIRGLIEDLDSLPFPDYSLLYDNTPMGSYPLKSIITSRGCPYNCTYCFNAVWRKIYQGKGKIVRRHSVNYIIDEIQYVKERWPLSFIKFYDDIFTYQADSWLVEFSKKYKKNIGLPFFILTRADLLSEDVVKLLKYAGCHTISMSIEAGNPEIRKKMLKRYMTNEQIIKAHHLCEKYSIYTFTNCIIGLPGTTIDNDMESVELPIKSKISWAEFPIFYPYPGTELGQYAIKNNYYKLNFEDMHTSYQFKSPLSCFTEREKNAQMNLCILGPIAVVFPFLKNLILKYLIFIKHNFLFTFFYYLTKMYVFRRKIYITKTNLWVSMNIFARSLRQEWFRHENQKG